MDEEFIQQLTQIIDCRLHDKHFGVAELAAEMGISRITLYRRVKLILNKQISKYIRELRLKRAFSLLQNKAGNATEVSAKVGFNQPTYFNKCFHNYFGITPGKVLRRTIVEILI